MILKFEMRYREGDTHRQNGRKDRRKHVLVKCDICGLEEWKIYHSFIKNTCYYKNNIDNRDFCAGCKRIRNKELNPFKIQTIEEKQIPKVRGKKRLNLSNGYIKTWINDLNHPRISKNKRDKNPTGGRVYEHILVVEQFIKRI